MIRFWFCSLKNDLEIQSKKESEIMKKFITLAYTIVIMIVMTGCSVQVDYSALQKRYDTLEDELSQQKDSYATLEEKYIRLSKYYNEHIEQTEKYNSSEAKTEPTHILLYENEYVSIYFIECRDGKFPQYGSKPLVVFEVENKTEKTIRIDTSCGSLAINGKELTDVMMSQQISPYSVSEVCAQTEQLDNYYPYSISGTFDITDVTNSSLGSQLSRVSFVNVSLSEKIK